MAYEDLRWDEKTIYFPELLQSIHFSMVTGASSQLQEVTVDLGSDSNIRIDWYMKLQRYEGGKWNTIGTRSGYVYKSSGSHRVFTNIRKSTNPLRVVVSFEQTASQDFISRNVYLV